MVSDMRILSLSKFWVRLRLDIINEVEYQRPERERERDRAKIINESATISIIVKTLSLFCKLIMVGHPTGASRYVEEKYSTT